MRLAALEAVQAGRDGRGAVAEAVRTAPLAERREVLDALARKCAGTVSSPSRLLRRAPPAFHSRALPAERRGIGVSHVQHRVR